MPEVIAER